MAGGRRPSNFAPSTRPSQAINSLHQLLSNGSTQGYWPPSVWQPPDLANTPPPAPPPLSQPLPPTQRLPAAPSSICAPQPPLVQPASTQLAQALDVAVQAAVIRALDLTSGMARVDDETASSGSSSSTRSIQPMESLSARLRSVCETNAAVLEQLKSLDARSLALERRLVALESRTREIEAVRIADVARIDARVTGASKRAADDMTALREQVESAARAEARVERARADRAERDGSSVREAVTTLSQRMDWAEESLTKQVRALSNEVEKDREEDKSRGASCAESCKAQAQELEKACVGAVEGLGSLRTRVRRLEVSSETREKKHDESSLLMDGAVENVRNELRCLKRLVESNLRAHTGAESVVKEQVSLITKHVCVAMRSYTSKKIEENNREMTARFLQLLNEARDEAGGGLRQNAFSEDAPGCRNRDRMHEQCSGAPGGQTGRKK